MYFKAGPGLATDDSVSLRPDEEPQHFFFLKDFDIFPKLLWRQLWEGNLKSSAEMRS